MSGKLAIIQREKYIISAMQEDDELVELDFEARSGNPILGNIYTGVVKNIVSNINAAFIEIADGILCYYSLQENKKHIFLNAKTNTKVVQGDVLLVQIIKENIKKKAPVATCYINITGKYFVLTYGKNNIGISNKILDTAMREQLRTLVSQYITQDYGIIVRTNAVDTPIELMERELQYLRQELDHILSISKYRTSLQLIYASPKSYIQNIRDQKKQKLDNIVTDHIDIYEDIKEYLEKFQPEDLNKLVFYDDPMLPLMNLLNLNKKIEAALQERVWLKSGGFLVIQPTEAMTVIDVNTGKAINKRSMEEHFYEINLEAAREIAKQLRLRNISGIVIIDFIDMSLSNRKEQLMKQLDGYLKQDRIKTTLVGISKLNLVELTRKKVKRPIYEELGSVCKACKGQGITYNL